MRISLITIRRCITIVALLFCAALLASAQESTGEAPSLGDVARKVRKENSAPGHVAGKTLANEEEDGPDTTGVWRVRLCTRTPCYELSVALPKNAKWTRAKDEPRPVLIPIPGPEPDAGRIIRLYGAELTSPSPAQNPFQTQLDGAKRLFLQGWFSRPEYFGQGARISLDERLQVDATFAVISHFSVAAAETKYLGESIVASSPNGNYGFACVYRSEDASSAASICDAILRSARSQALEPGARPLYPNYLPPQYYPYYPRIDDPARTPPGVEDPTDPED